VPLLPSSPAPAAAESRSTLPLRVDDAVDVERPVIVDHAKEEEEAALLLRPPAAEEVAGGSKM
jgi:hypothetical protein